MTVHDQFLTWFGRIEKRNLHQDHLHTMSKDIHKTKEVLSAFVKQEGVKIFGFIVLYSGQSFNKQ